MRKQYHFRPGDRGLRAWDVDRLIELTRHLPRKRIPVQSIQEIEEPYWFSHDGPAPTCRAIIEHFRFVQEVDLSHPIILCSAGRVMDGMHRVAKAVIEGRTEIDAVQFITDPAPDYEGVSPSELPYA